MPDYLVYAGAAAILYLGIVAIVFSEKLESARLKISELEYENHRLKYGGFTVEILNSEDFDTESLQLVSDPVLRDVLEEAAANPGKVVSRVIDRPIDYTLTDKAWGFEERAE